MQNVIMVGVIMLNIIMLICHFAECHFTEGRYAECCGAIFYAGKFKSSLHEIEFQTQACYFFRENMKVEKSDKIGIR
jgi:hypothetical protein